MVAVAALMKAAPELQGENLVYVSGMEVARGARGRIAQRVQKASQASASLMEVAGAANSQNVRRVHKEAQFSARHMVEGKGAHFWDVPKGQKGALHFVRDMVEGNAARTRVVVCAQRACMAGPNSVLHTVVGRGVLLLGALEVLEAEQIAASVTAVASDASTINVIRVLRGALTFVKHTEVASAAHGAIQVPT